VWVGEEIPGPPATSPVSSREVMLSSKDIGEAAWVFVLDVQRNIVAAKEIKSITSPWNVSEKDFARIGKVSVRVQHKGAAVKGGVVTLTQGSNGRTGILAESDAGELNFYGLPPGKTILQVSYKSKGSTLEYKPFPSTSLDLKEAKDLEPFIVELPEETETISSSAGSTDKGTESSATADKEKSEAPAPAAGPSVLQRIINTIVGLALGVGILFGMLWLLRNKREEVVKRLENLGVSIPEDPKQDTLQAAVPAKPEPIQPIMLGADAAPTPAAGGNTGFVAPSAPSTPKLLGANGQTLTLSEGVLTVGREAPAQLVVASGSVSRTHASVTVQGSSVTVSDSGSTNGTFVNGQKIDSPTTLRHGDQVFFGTEGFRFEV
jgi:pSer/pThr/pTyr-binding forkhead associated (FHA) protein